MKAEDILKDIKEDLYTTLLATRTGMKNIENDLSLMYKRVEDELSKYNSEQTAPERAYIDSVKEAMDSSEEQNKFQEEEKIYAVKNKDNYLLCFFKNKEKAEQYCECHEGSHVEEYEFADERTFTPYNFVEIDFNIKKGEDDSINFKFRKKFLEEDLYYTKNRETLIPISEDSFQISVLRFLPYNYNEQEIKDMYIKRFNKIRYEIVINYLEMIKLITEDISKEKIELFQGMKKEVEARIRAVLWVEAFFLKDDNVIMTKKNNGQVDFIRI